MTSGGKRLTRHNSTVCPLRGHLRYCTLNFFSFVLFKGGDTRQQENHVWVGGGSAFVAEWREAGCGTTTPPGCVNEKERGQEESAGSTTEVLTEGIEGLRLHLFRPSTLPAGPPPEPQPSLGICDGGRGPVPPPAPHSQLFLWLQRERWGNAGGSICRGLPAWGKGAAGPSLLSHGGLTVVEHSAAHHTSHASWSGSLPL